MSLISAGFMWSWKTWKSHGIWMSDFQASRGEVMEILKKKCKKSPKMEIYHKKWHSGQMQNVIFLVRFLYTRTDPFCVQGWVLKGHGISSFYHGKFMEKSFNLKAQKEHEPGGGVLSGKVGTEMCGPDRVLFRPLRFTNGPFFIWKLV